MARFTLEQYQQHLSKPKKGSPPSAPSLKDGPEMESELHRQIADSCHRRGWKPFHGSMSHRSRRTLGEPDFIVMASNGRVLFIECKVKNRKRSPAQIGVQMIAEINGHTVHLVRALKEFDQIADALG